MRTVKTIPYKFRLIHLGVCLAVMQGSESAIAQESDNEVDEIIVTGSYIRRSEGFQMASPLTQITAEDLQLEGTMNMGEVVKSLSFNLGSSTTSTTQGTSDSSTGFNLRGLGESSTLLLIDGMRAISNNVNVVLPGIAMERLDIVTDGAAALYGSSAVAGVVNFVPIKSYDGAKVEYFREGDDRGDFHDQQFSTLLGTTIDDRIHLVLGGEFRKQGDFSRGDRPELLRAGQLASTTSNPGRYLVPTRDATGKLTGETVTRSDPNCGGEREDPAKVGSNPRGFTDPRNGHCLFDSGDSRSYRNKQDKTSIFSNATFDVSPDVTLSTQFLYSRQVIYTRASTSNPGGRVSALPIVRGEIPGNPFRAVDGNSNPLFAQDLNGDGVPDRDSSGVVILDSNGIPFNEDVKLSQWRPLGKHGTMPSQLNKDFSFPQETDARQWRWATRADFKIPFAPEWEGAVFYTAAKSQEGSIGNNFSFGAIEKGLLCDTVNDRSACFSPFVSTDPSTLNSQTVMDAIMLRDRNDNSEELQTLDAVFNGRVPMFGWELPGGAINAAFGFQRREEKFDNSPPISQIKGDAFIGIQQDPVSGSRDVNALFAEISIPVLDNLEASLAIRQEKYSTGQESTDPKYGLTYMPFNWLSLRATVGDSFIAPTLDQLQSPQNCGLTQAVDPFTPFSAFTASCSQGNPNLRPESSRSTSIGFTLMPLDNLSLSLNWSKTDFGDRIVNSTTTDVLAADFFRFRQTTGFQGSGFPSLAQVAAWVADPRSDKRIERNPNNLEQIDRIISGASNASRMLVKATDLDFSYRFPIGDLGNFNVSVQASYVDSYEYQISPERDTVNAVGKQNSSTGAVPAMPRWKGNMRFGWYKNNHSININLRYVDNMIFDAPKNAAQALYAYSNYRDVNEIHTWTQADASYTYQQLQALGGDFNLTIGSRNLFDRQAQKSPMPGGVIGELQDPLGRVIYVRIGFEF